MCRRGGWRTIRPSNAEYAGADTVNCFMWLPGGELPAVYDLRRRGWSRVLDATPSCSPRLLPALLSDSPAIEKLFTQFSASELERLIAVGIPHSQERARLLRLGLGDALGPGVSLEEIEARAAQVIRTAGHFPALREHGPLTLDLLLRDGFVHGRRLGLHPREFALLWRLSAQPGRLVRSEVLIADVWRLMRRPETNSLAVHIYRLRQKLRPVGMAEWVQTVGSDGYQLAACGPHPATTEPPCARLDLCQPAERV